MRKFTAIICVLFALVMALALPVGAATPYQTYTYSIDGKALHSPDAYTPDKTIDAAAMGLNDYEFLKEFYPSLIPLHDAMEETKAAAEEAQRLFDKKYENRPSSEQSKDDKDDLQQAWADANAAQKEYDTQMGIYGKIDTPSDI
ncbi:MAG: hypothetical protein IJD64_04645, partial [Clostridia bacterium]|nr:hypothetical protein [Clostridia bacterium]